MVGLVIVSHSAVLARGVVELARQMGGEEVAIEAAGGMAEPEGEIGTDATLVMAAIERAAGPDGVLVLMDLGSAVMSAEMAVEMLAGGPRVLLCEAPLVEGAVAAAARARTGAPLEEVAAEARSALGMKAAQLGVEPDAPSASDAPSAPAGGAELRLKVPNALGLHARPAARVVETAARFDAQVTVVDETTGRGPADARSLTALVTLGARKGHDLLVTAAGPDADAALAALRGLAEDGFGDEDGAAAPPPAPAVPTTPPPSAGDRMHGVAASTGIAIAPARHPGAAGAGSSAGAPGAGSLAGAAAAGAGSLAGAAGAGSLAGSAGAGSSAGAADAEPTGDPGAERARLDAARGAARRDVEAARERIAAQAGAAEAGIFDAHLLLLEDSALLGPAHEAIERGDGAVAAWRAVAADAAAAYRDLDDPYLRERAADVEDVAARVLQHLGAAPAPSTIAEPGILVVRDLTPAGAAALDRDLVQGLAIARGSATSHAAILARALGIPAVAGLGDGILAVAEGTLLVVDGGAGTVEVDPPADAVAAHEQARAAAEERRRRARARAAEPARTRDGTTIEVAANVGDSAEAAAAVELGADGIGLLRTEFLFLDREDPPTEDEQRAVYEQVATAMGGRPVIVRTLDAGADKPLPFLPQPPEDNPFLGVRGIRISLARPEIFTAQLRAIVAVAARHPLRVMFPMVTTVAEYRAARARVEAVRAELGAPPIDIGVMVEVPAVALAADRFAREVDFFSIGTNDLSQYALAAERGNERLAPLLAGTHPAVLRLVDLIATAAEAHGRWVGVCGELAGDPGAAVLLSGLGVRELSMAPSRIPECKEALRTIALTDARAVAREALELDDAEAVAAAVAPLLDS